MPHITTALLIPQYCTGHQHSKEYSAPYFVAERSDLQNDFRSQTTHSKSIGKTIGGSFANALEIHKCRFNHLCSCVGMPLTSRDPALHSHGRGNPLMDGFSQLTCQLSLSIWVKAAAWLCLLLTAAKKRYRP